MTAFELRRYRQSLILGLIGVVKQLFPGEQLKISHSILDGVYCELVNSTLSIREVQKIEDHLRNWVLADQSIPYEVEQDNLYHCLVDNEKITTIYPPLRSNGIL